VGNDRRNIVFLNLVVGCLVAQQALAYPCMEKYYCSFCKFTGDILLT